MPAKHCVNTLRVLRVILFSVVRCIDDLLDADLTDGVPDIDDAELTENLSTVERELVDLIFEDVERPSGDADMVDENTQPPWDERCSQDSVHKS